MKTAKDKITWAMLKEIADSRHSGHYSETETCWNRGRTLRLHKWVSDEKKSPRLSALADFINREFDGKLRADVSRTTTRSGRQLRSGVYYTQSLRTGNLLRVTRNGKLVYEHNSAETYRSNSEVVSWILDMKGEL